MSRTKVFKKADADDGPSLADVAELIKSDKVKNVIVLVGAGISTGIPDFRSEHTGLYANLQKYNLPFPEAIFDLNYFMRRPEAFFTLAKEIYPGNYNPTLTHYFFVLLRKKGLLKRVFTQNVDTLERLAGLPGDMLVEAHGSFATAHCLMCREKFDAETLRPRIAKGEILRCEKASCKGKPKALIKSDIVFFGEALPELFFKRLSDFKTCDLLITIGTSLKVQPFASLIDRVDDDCPRLLINLEPVGEMDEYEGGGMFGSYREDGFDFYGSSRGGQQFARDVLFLGEADKGIEELARALGWADELQRLYDEGHAALAKQDLNTKDDPSSLEAAGQQAAETAQVVTEATVSDAPATLPKAPLPTTDADDVTGKLASLEIQNDGVAAFEGESATVPLGAQERPLDEASAASEGLPKVSEPNARNKTAAL